MNEVLANAIEHNDAESPRVAIDVLSGGGSDHVIEIQVADNGPGIPEGELKPLREGEEEPVIHLSGLGLWFVSWTIRKSGGSLQFDENEQGGTTVRIQIPEAPEEAGSLLSFLASLRK